MRARLFIYSGLVLPGHGDRTANPSAPSLEWNRPAASAGALQGTQQTQRSRDLGQSIRSQVECQLTEIITPFVH